MNQLAPRPHQALALQALHRTSAPRMQLRMACGAGKTLIGRWYAADINAQQTVVLCPSLALVAQTLREWRRSADWPFEALVVCSDPTTSAGAAERAGHEGAYTQLDIPTWAKARARVTTNPQVVSSFLASRREGRPQVIFSTYHSAPAVVAATKTTPTVFDLVVCDEAHHLAGRPRAEFRATWEISAKSWLFMTATPLIFTGASDKDVISMNDPEKFGAVAHTLTFGSAIDAGLLTDYRVFVRGSVGHNPAHVLPGCIIEAAERHGLRSLITYHGRNTKAAALAEALDGVRTPTGWTIRARHISGATPASERSATLAWLGEPSDEIRIVTNVNCLIEGVDVPSVDGVALCDPRTSTVGIVQAIGRVLRPAPGKLRGAIILPIMLPLHGDDDSALLASRFGHVWKALRALRAHDQRLASELDAAAADWARRASEDEMAGLSYRGAKRPTSRVHFELPGDIDMSRVYLRMVQQTATKNAYFYGLLLDWADHSGGRTVPWTLTWKGERLGRWAEQQRRAYQKGLLDKEQIAALESVPGWAWDRKEGVWRDSYRILKDLATQLGSLHQPPDGPSIYAGIKDATNLPLGHWVAEQRQLYRDGMLSDERAQLLEELPGWTWDGGLPDDDVAMIQALRVYCEFEKHADVPEAHLEDGLPLGRWVWAVRRRRLVGRLHPTLEEEIAAATPRTAKGEPSFAWHVAETRWRLAYSALRQYTRREGTATPPCSHRETLPDTTVGLGQWASLQRCLYRKGKLEERYIRWLEALPGWRWEAPRTRKEYGEPLDLGDHPHGTAKGIAAGCPCKECMDAARARQRQYLARRRALKDGVPAGKARRHINRLTKAGYTLAAINAVCSVPVGVLRDVGSGKADQISARHEAAVLAVTPAMCASVPTRVGSRGRVRAASSEQVPAAPTRRLLEDLASRGFGPAWVARELGYDRKVQIGHDKVLRRMAEAVADLHARVGDLVAPPTSGRRMPPPLAELLNRPRGEAA